MILPVPRYYKCDISLAPEMDNTENGGKLSSIASSFGVDLGDVASANALQPSLYPDLMKSNEFVKSLLQIPVETKRWFGKKPITTIIFLIIRKSRHTLKRLDGLQRSLAIKTVLQAKPDSY